MNNDFLVDDMGDYKNDHSLHPGFSALFDSAIFSSLLMIMIMMMISMIMIAAIMVITIQVLAHLVTVRYSPPSWRPLHWLSLVAAATGVALLLLSRGHYSIGK